MAKRSTEAQKRRVAQLLRDAVERGCDHDESIVHHLIARCIDVGRRERKAGPPKMRSAMPDIVRSYDERETDARQRSIDIEDGGDRHVVLGLGHFGPSAEEIEDAAAIESVFKDAMGGENPDRDWKLLFQLAAGKGQHQLGRCNCHGAPKKDNRCARTCRITHEPTISRQRIINIRADRLSAIWKALRPLMPVSEAA